MVQFLQSHFGVTNIAPPYKMLLLLKTFALSSLLMGWAVADSTLDIPHNLPLLYRVDQSSSNVVVFRGANVAKARDAGYLKDLSYLSSARTYSNAAGSGNSGNNYNNAYNGDSSAAYNNDAGKGSSYATTPAYTTTTPAPTTTTAYTTTTTAAYQPPVTQAPYTTPAPKVTYERPAYVNPYAKHVPYNSHHGYQSSYAKPVPAYGSQYSTGPSVEANYDWEYAVKDNHYNDFGHKESRHGYSATGKYYVALPDGRFQTVTYVADENGFNPVVEFSGESTYPEEPKGYN